MPVTGSRDLSKEYSGRIEVEIRGVGSFTTDFGMMSLAQRVAHAQTCLTRKSTTVFNPAAAPWEIVAFDAQRGKLIVKVVKKKW